MHHWRNAGPENLNSMTPFRRTSLLEFCWFASKLSLSVMFGSGLLVQRRVSPRRRITLAAKILGFWALRVTTTGQFATTQAWSAGAARTQLLDDAATLLRAPRRMPTVPASRRCARCFLRAPSQVSVL